MGHGNQVGWKAIPMFGEMRKVFGAKDSLVEFVFFTERGFIVQFTFDANSSGSTDDRLSPGVFIFVCKQAELKATKANDGSYVNACFEVADGPCKGKRVYNRFTYQNKSEKAQEIGHKQLSQYCLAIGKSKISDIVQLEGVPFSGTLSERTETYNGETRKVFEITKFEACDAETKARVEAEIRAAIASAANADNVPF